VVLEQDVMLHFPYHSFNPVIDMLRKRRLIPTDHHQDHLLSLASNSKIINAYSSMPSATANMSR